MPCTIRFMLAMTWLLLGAMGCASPRDFENVNRERLRLESELSKSREQVAVLEAQNRDLAARLGDALRRTEQLRRDWDALKETDAGAALVAQLRTELGAESSSAASLVAENESLTSGIKELTAKLDTMKGDVARLRQDNARLSGEVERLTPSIPTSPSVIESKIDGDFEGWEGETVVKLMNGQIWQQTDFYYRYHYAFMPPVLVFESGAGFKMKVEGIDKAVGVRQLR